MNETEANKSSVRILIADDSELMRSGLCSILESRPEWTVCGEAVDGEDALKKAIELQPDIVLMDVSMPRLNGFQTAKAIHEKVPRVQVLIVTEHDARSLAHLPPQPGVLGYVSKGSLVHDLVSVVDAASRHQPLPLAKAAH
jgi:DNA-binding NarL/FixJ family response regulator